MPGIVGLARILLDKARWTPSDDEVRGLLREILDTSLQTEEGRSPACLVTCYQRTGRPPLISRFTPVPLTSTSLTKLALATDPRTSSIAALHGTNGWEIHGIVDRGLESGTAGAFQVEIEGVGHLAVHANGVKLAELIGSEIHQNSADVLGRGLLADSLALTPNEVLIVKDLLYRIRRFGHGGAVVISSFSEPDAHQMEVKYRTTYGGLKNRGRALDRSLWFVATLSRVDGAVLLRPDLEVVGFGAFLRCAVPAEVHVSKRTDGLQPRRHPATTWGTRHQSMFGYCLQDKGAAGFLISSDGDVRAVKFDPFRRRLIVWERVAVKGRNLPPGR